MSSSIAIVDDDTEILASVKSILEGEGYQVRAFSDGAEALRSLGQTPADLAVLDIKMPRTDGLEVLAQIRKHSRMPVIFLTSKDEELDEVLGLRVGADDYIKKPFSRHLLVERIRVLLRRIELRKSNNDGGPVVRCGELTLDPGRHECSWKGRHVDLTVTEFLILKSLASRPGRVLNRNQLMDSTYGENIYVDDRTIDTHVKRLRKKLKLADPEFAHIETLYGVGYRYREE